MSWQAASFSILALVLLAGFVWFERSRPPARIVAAVAAMAALGVAGRLALAPIPNVVATTDVALLAGYALGAGPGFAVGALSGLVSNFWLGQGPWTPWQMAGWGMVGIAGAVLARASGRRLGRLPLACLAALAGLAYGALLDLSVMVEFGGEQSLDRYLALSARGIPFNIAHAAGNFVLMFAAGPALVRMLDRYRGRFAYRWSDAPIGRAAATLVLVACLLGPLLAPRTSAAGEGRKDAQAWLQGAKNDDGGFGTEPDADSSTGMTGWAILGLEAAGINPRDLRGGGNTPIEYLRDNEEEITSTADLERTILALEGAGLDSRSFEGRDLVAELRDRQNKDGSFQRQVNLTAFAILAQRAAGVPGSNYGKPASWLRGVQNRNGGWGSAPGAESEPDSTGSAMQALAVAPGGSGQLREAARWLERVQHRDGGWSLTSGADSNSQSTAWAVQGLTAAAVSAGTIRENGSSGPDFIVARQDGDGHYAYSKASDQTPVWVTAQGLTGIAKEPFPILAVERAAPDSGTDQSGAQTDADGTGGSSGSSSSGTPTPSSPPPSYDLGGDSGYDPYDGGGSFGNGADPFGSGNGGGGGRGGSSPAAPGGLPPGAGAGGPESESPNDPTGGLETFAQSAAPLAELPSQDSPLPDTFVFLAGIGALGAGLGGGFVWYRRRNP